MSIFGNNLNRHNRAGRQPSWQAYQKRLTRSRRTQLGRKWILAMGTCLVLVLVLYMGWTSQSAATTPLSEAVEVPSPSQALRLSKKDVQLLLSHARIEDLGRQHIAVHLGQQQLDLQTSLDMGLQDHLLAAMDRKNSRYVAVVAMDPGSGRILSLAGFNKSDATNNPCMGNQFPAASIFKIVTATAAVDICGIKPNTRLNFNGDKYTLYKNQLKDGRNRYTNTLSFRESFAQSVNPVFGKLGMGRLKKPILKKYGEAFGFNQPIAFELTLPPSRLNIKNTPYHWAEIASGFNNETTLSPVHAALMASAVVNQGEMMVPTIVDRIVDADGILLYQGQQQPYRQVMSQATSAILTELMTATVKSGTARKAFRHQNQDRILADLIVGGKTGSIFNKTHDVRFDWFVGFAQQKKGRDQLALAVMVGHEDYIGIRAAAYARMAMRYYFGTQLARGDGNSRVKKNTNG